MTSSDRGFRSIRRLSRHPSPSEAIGASFSGKSGTVIRNDDAVQVRVILREHRTAARVTRIAATPQVLAALHRARRLFP